MKFLTIVAIIAIVIVGTIAAIVAIAKVSAFYKQRFGFSLWSGVLLFVLALSLAIISTATDVGTHGQFILLAFSVFLVLLTGYNDIRLAGLWWGVLALFLQILFSLCFVVFIFCALVGLVMKKIFNIRNSLITSVFDGFGLKGELALLLYFLHP